MKMTLQSSYFEMADELTMIGVRRDDTYWRHGSISHHPDFPVSLLQAWLCRDFSIV